MLKVSPECTLNKILNSKAFSSIHLLWSIKSIFMGKSGNKPVLSISIHSAISVVWSLASNILNESKVHYSYCICLFTVFGKILTITYSIKIGCIMLQTFLPAFFFYLSFLLLCLRLFCFCLLIKKVSLVNRDYLCHRAAVSYRTRTAKSNLLNHPILYKFAGS